MRRVLLAVLFAIGIPAGHAMAAPQILGLVATALLAARVSPAVRAGMNATLAEDVDAPKGDDIFEEGGN